MVPVGDAPSSTEPETRTVALPAATVERIESRLPGTTFESADEYVRYVIEEALTNVETSDGAVERNPTDRDDVERRLRSLGYLEDL